MEAGYPSSGSFHLGEVPGVGVGAARLAQPNTPAPGGCGHQEEKWVREGLERKPIGPMTSFAAPGEVRLQRPASSPREPQFLVFFRKEASWNFGIWAGESYPLDRERPPPISTPSKPDPGRRFMQNSQLWLHPLIPWLTDTWSTPQATHSRQVRR